MNNLKKTLLSLAVVSAAAPALAGNVGFEFGSNFYRPNFDPTGSNQRWFGQGQNFSVIWGNDQDYWFGYYTESTNLNDGLGDAESMTVQAVQISRSILKGVSITGRLGEFYESYNGYFAPLADVSAEVTILTGAGDKVSGDLRASVGARFANDTFQNSGQSNWSGEYINLSVGLSF